VLKQLSSQHEIPNLIIMWRKLSHTLSKSVYPIERVSIKSFIEKSNLKLFFFINFSKAKAFSENGLMTRINSSVDLFNVTGRMNFNDPCLQNIPRDFDISLEGLTMDSQHIDSADDLVDCDGLFFLRK
jgi:hypothetical protein